MSVVPKLQGRVRPPLDHGRFHAMQRTDGVWIVYDPARPVGQRTAWTGLTEAEASVACKRLSDEADARGEPNARERKGFAWDWSDPRTWER